MPVSPTSSSTAGGWANSLRSSEPEPPCTCGPAAPAPGASASSNERRSHSEIRPESCGSTHRTARKLPYSSGRRGHEDRAAGAGALAVRGPGGGDARALHLYGTELELREL